MGFVYENLIHAKITGYTVVPTGHWERDLREESLKEGQEQGHALWQPMQISGHFAAQGYAHDL